MTNYSKNFIVLLETNRFGEGLTEGGFPSILGNPFVNGPLSESTRLRYSDRAVSTSIEQSLTLIEQSLFISFETPNSL